MNHTGFLPAIAVSLLLLVSGCAAGANSADAASPTSGATMSVSDAQAFVTDVQRQRGLPAPAPVSSIDELLEVLTTDQMDRFGEGERLVAGKPGVDALTLHASLELAWSDDLKTLSLILAELGKRADAEVRRLSARREAGAKLSDAEQKDLEQNQKNLDFDSKAQAATEALAQEHLRAAGLVVAEARRQFPKDPLTYRVLAYHALLSGEWLAFDGAIEPLKDKEATDPGLVYLRALESLKRFAVRKDAAVLLRKALQLNPKLLRAQAKLTLVEEGIDAKYAEFEKLKAQAANHPIVWLAGPSMTSDYELSASFRKARAAQQPGPAVTPAAAAPAAPTAPPAAVAPPPAP
ncbi:MAG TPA: hypothetical protein VFK05_11625 [Polyangiaceae bacterium]|nr:hypothetical protein [Polyangiaceae bacterium]